VAGVVSSVSARGLSVVPREGLSPRCAAMAEGTPAMPVAQHKKNKNINEATGARSRRGVCNGALASVTRSLERAGVLIAHELSRNDSRPLCFSQAFIYIHLQFNHANRISTDTESNSFPSTSSICARPIRRCLLRAHPFRE